MKNFGVKLQNSLVIELVRARDEKVVILQMINLHLTKTRHIQESEKQERLLLRRSKQTEAEVGRAPGAYRGSGSSSLLPPFFMYKVREIQSSDYIDCFNNQHIAHGLHQRGLWTQDIWGFVARWFRPSYVTEIEGRVIAHIMWDVIDQSHWKRVKSLQVKCHGI